MIDVAGSSPTPATDPRVPAIATPAMMPSERIGDESLAWAAASGLMAARRGLLDRPAMAGKTQGKSTLSRQSLDSITRKWFGDAKSSQAGDEATQTLDGTTESRSSRIEW
jgi:hypothetical protein